MHLFNGRISSPVNINVLGIILLKQSHDKNSFKYNYYLVSSQY